MLTVGDPPKVSFLLSSVNMAVATTAWTHSGHPHLAGSRILDKEATGCFFSPYSWVRTPKTVPLSTLINRQKGFFREGRENTGVVTRECLSSSIIRISSGPN
jgi:hypothetical protein